MSLVSNINQFQKEIEDHTAKTLKTIQEETKQQIEKIKFHKEKSYFKHYTDKFFWGAVAIGVLAFFGTVTGIGIGEIVRWIGITIFNIVIGIGNWFLNLFKPN